jgi:hypothetical protein
MALPPRPIQAARVNERMVRAGLRQRPVSPHPLPFPHSGGRGERVVALEWEWGQGGRGVPG